uniref:Uncharacterized protein n=1 Tax=Arundo donax TaxID=35708 RepID=A0A0A9BRT4_ARUDO
MDICVDDPIATASELSNLSFTANITALMCSATFLTIGSKTALMNEVGMLQALEAPSIASTK